MKTLIPITLMTTTDINTSSSTRVIFPVWILTHRSVQLVRSL